MLIKLAIIVGIVVLGGTIFYNEIERFFPDTISTIPGSLSADVEGLRSEATVFVGDRINQTAAKLGEVTEGATRNIVGGLESAPETLLGENSTLNPLDRIGELIPGQDDTGEETAQPP